MSSPASLHDDIPFELAALVACGVPTGWGSAVYAAGVQAGQTVVIYGCGGDGANAVQDAFSAGAQNVVVVDPVPFQAGEGPGAGSDAHLQDPDEARRLVKSATRGQYTDHAIITVGVNDETVVASAIAVTGKGGRVTITATGRASERQVMAYDGLLGAYQRQVQGRCSGRATRSTTSRGWSAYTAAAISSWMSSSPAGTRSTSSTTDIAPARRQEHPWRPRPRA